MSATPDAQAEFAVRPPYDLDETLAFQRAGPFDPTSRAARGRFVKAWLTAAGPATLELAQVAPDLVEARAWGPGAAEAILDVPSFAGLDDDPAATLDTTGGPVRALFQRFRGLRLSRAPWLVEATISTVLQQRVTFAEAMRAFSAFVELAGADAPGPYGAPSGAQGGRARLEPGLVAAPSGRPLRVLAEPRRLRRIASPELLSLGVDARRAQALFALCAHVPELLARARAPHAEVRAYLSHYPGYGPWSLGHTLGFGLGDPDAVPFGDFHLANTVAWFLRGVDRGTDAELERDLAPYAGFRFRVVRLLAAGRVSAPRHGPSPKSAPLPPRARRSGGARGPR
jgi:3-methyladenine DNA glycosylase/8-oxoguanine DNA glycosylase